MLFACFIYHYHYNYYYYCYYYSYYFFLWLTRMPTNILITNVIYTDPNFITNLQTHKINSVALKEPHPLTYLKCHIIDQMMHHHILVGKTLLFRSRHRAQAPAAQIMFQHAPSFGGCPCSPLSHIFSMLFPPLCKDTF